MKTTGPNYFLSILLAIMVFTVTDSYAQLPEVAVDSLSPSLLIDGEISIVDQPSKHLPRKATMYSAVLPGLGQIYNKSYWKLAVVYGGFGAIGYYINWNQTMLNTSSKAYFDLSDRNPETNSHKALFPERDFSSPNTILDTQTVLKRYIEGYRRQRDLLIIGAIGFYFFNILDANVEAHLIDFDISEDLTLNVIPFAIDPLNNSPIFGAQLTLRF